MQYWFTSDQHYGHFNIIKYCERPFKSLEHMNETIIRNHNSRVKDGDIVFSLGDFCFRNSSEERGEGVKTKCQEWENRLNSKIIHISGNHDNSNGVPKIIQGILIKYHNHDVYMVHKPEHYNKNYEINFVGHVHGNWSVKLPGDTIRYDKGKSMVVKSTLVNVGVDVNKFMPVSFTELMAKIKKHKRGSNE